MTEDINPQAFPVTTAHHVRCEGMTLRDWFAGMALQGLLASVNDLGFDFNEMADRAFGMADQMLKSRKNK